MIDNLREFGRHNYVTWTEADLRKERQEMDWDYECIICGHRITVPLGQKTPPNECEKCHHTWCYLTKEIIEENERLNAKDS